MATNGQVLTSGGLAAAVVVLIDYFTGLAAPPAIIAAATTVFTAVFIYGWAFLPKRSVAQG